MIILRQTVPGAADRRCDANCYNDTTPTCDCCCRGRNHGVGLERAIALNRDLHEDLLNDPDNPTFDGLTIQITTDLPPTPNPGQAQPALFPEAPQ